jgi:hypothetical protein
MARLELVFLQRQRTLVFRIIEKMDKLNRLEKPIRGIYGTEGRCGRHIVAICQHGSRFGVIGCPRCIFNLTGLNNVDYTLINSVSRRSTWELRKSFFGRVFSREGDGVDRCTHSRRAIISLSCGDQVDPDIGLTPGLPRGRSLVLVRAPWAVGS